MSLVRSAAVAVLIAFGAIRGTPDATILADVTAIAQRNQASPSQAPQPSQRAPSAQSPAAPPQPARTPPEPSQAPVEAPGAPPAPDATAMPAVPFDQFVADLGREALARGISQATVTLALSGLSPDPVVVARDRAQPETTLSLDAYVERQLTPRLVVNAKRETTARATLLSSVSKEYGIPGPILMAVWAIESNFGKFTGTYPTIQSLATLAYDGRRAIFRDELFAALAIVEQRQIPPGELKGSWAGAMGQPQFMPSSFLKHAVDFDRDGRVDIWHSEADVFGSMANFLRGKGWIEGGRWGREVTVTRAAMDRIDRDVPMQTQGCRALRALTVARPLSVWKSLGVTLAGGRPLPASTMSASLVRGEHRNFLVYANYGALLEYNCSNAYAITIGLLADRIAD